MSAKGNRDLAVLSFENQSDWEAWLSECHDKSDGIWLKIAKKEAGCRTVTYTQALECAICYGWIDGQKAAFNEQYWLQQFSHRRPRSKWSKINRQRAEALIASGRMQPSGLHQVQLAKSDGRWEAAYASQSEISVPEDLQHELDQNPRAKSFFDSLNSINRYAILYRIQDAQKPETRAARIKKFMAMLENKQVLHP